VPRVYGGGLWGGVFLSPLGVGSGSPSPENFLFLGLKMLILVRSPAHLECLFLQRNTSRSIPALRLPTLTFQADCGSIKGAGVSAEEGTEVNIIFPGSEYMINLITANVETLSPDDSYSFSSDGHQFRGEGGMAPCPPSGSATEFRYCYFVSL